MFLPLCHLLKCGKLWHKTEETPLFIRLLKNITLYQKREKRSKITILTALTCAYVLTRNVDEIVKL